MLNINQFSSQRSNLSAAHATSLCNTEVGKPKDSNISKFNLGKRDTSQDAKRTRLGNIDFKTFNKQQYALLSRGILQGIGLKEKKTHTVANNSNTISKGHQLRRQIEKSAKSDKALHIPGVLSTKMKKQSQLKEFCASKEQKQSEKESLTEM